MLDMCFVCGDQKKGFRSPPQLQCDWQAQIRITDLTLINNSVITLGCSINQHSGTLTCPEALVWNKWMCACVPVLVYQGNESVTLYITLICCNICNNIYAWHFNFSCIIMYLLILLEAVK